MPIFELRVFAEQKLGMAFVHRHPWRGGTDAVQVFHSKNSLLFYLHAVPGGGGTDAAGYKPRDVCVSKLEFNSVQGRTLLNDWHMMENLKSA